MPLRVAIVGAPGTGKTTLALELQTVSSAANAAFDFCVDEASALSMVVADGPSQAQQHADIAAVMALHRRYHLTLLLGLDLAVPGSAPSRPATAAQQTRVDTWLRQTLNAHNLAFTVVYGNGPARLDCALQAIAHHISSFDAAKRRHSRGAASTWQWCCDTCSDAACEHQLFSALIKKPSVRA